MMIQIRMIMAVLIAATVTTASPVSGQSMDDTLLNHFQPDWPLGDPRRCQEQFRSSNLDIQRFEVLPGIGWDNLRNLEAGVVVTYNFSQCKVTDDGNLLIPDNMYTIPIKESKVETFAELIDNWSRSSSTTSNSININAGFSTFVYSISGKFSWEHQQLKTKQTENKAMTTRVQLRYHRYEAKLQPDPELDPHFKSRLLSIAALVERGRHAEARYEGQLLVRDFGTHVLTSVTAGAGLIKDDYIDQQFVEEKINDKTSILASASGSFFNVFELAEGSGGFSYGHKAHNSLDTEYKEKMRHSFIKTLGGPMYRPQNMTVNDWINNVDGNLVAMDRSGDPLYFFVTAQTLPELPAITVSKVEKIVRESAELYYKMNVIPGCTKLSSPSFSFSANFDDGSCTEKPTNLTFGGVYQTCKVTGDVLHKDPCSGLTQVNPDAGGFSCPPSYTPIMLHSDSYAQTENEEVCGHCWWIFGWCCHTNQHKSEAHVETYWCAAVGPVPSDSGYMFGGLYTSTTQNPVTGDAGCPPNFFKFLLFTDLYVCLGDDYELGEGLSIPFGGFFSCDKGNPLAVANSVHPVGSKGTLGAPKKKSLRAFFAASGGETNWPSKCPKGYSQHMATTVNGCAVHYCIQTSTLTSPTLPPIKRPPFVKKPPTVLDDEDNIVMFDLQGQTWKKNEQAVAYMQSVKVMPSEIRTDAKTMIANIKSNRQSANVLSAKIGTGASTLTASTTHDSGSVSPGLAAGISVVGTLGCVALATTIIVIIHKRRSRKNGGHRRLSEETWPTARYGSNHGSVETHNVDTVNPTQPHSSV